MKDRVCEAIILSGYGARLAAWSALDHYFSFSPLPFTWVETDADLSVLARLFEGLRFPGVDIADAALDQDGATWYFRCLDRETAAGLPECSFDILSFFLDGKSGHFLDPLGLYPLLRELRDGLPPASLRESLRDGRPWWAAANPRTGRFRAAADAALILARYAGASPARHGAARPGDGGEGQEAGKRLAAEIGAALHPAAPADTAPERPPPPEFQRVLLVSLLLSSRPDLGLEVFRAAGCLAELWPELAALEDVDHSKEYHPEGNVWDHTLETFRYRKAAARGAQNLCLSLGLLLHDLGKPLAERSGEKRFNGHAELGARAAMRFMERLGFGAALAGDVYFLVRNHMFPAALPRLPPSRAGETAGSPLFPLLLELYRCDESSSFKGLDNYYESAAAYKNYLRSLKNPWHSAAGKPVRTRQKQYRP